MTTALDLARRGLRFDLSSGSLRLAGPAELRSEARAEIVRRAEIFRKLLPSKRPYAPVRIVPGDRSGRMEYYGGCEHCDDPLSKHRGGTCPLCAAAIRVALGLVKHAPMEPPA